MAEGFYRGGGGGGGRGRGRGRGGGGGGRKQQGTWTERGFATNEDNRDRNRNRNRNRNEYGSGKNNDYLYIPPYKSEYFDTHVHLDMILQRLYSRDMLSLENPLNRLPEFIQKCIKGNFGGCVTVACDIAQWETVSYILDHFGIQSQDNNNNNGDNDNDDIMVINTEEKIKEKESNNNNKNNNNKNNNNKLESLYSYKIYGAFGIHPHNAKQWNETIENKLIDLLLKYRKKNQCVAIGECGLDYFIKPGRTELLCPKSIQLKTFEAQLRIAQSLELPLIVHTRAADDDCLKLLCQIYDTNEKRKKQKIHIHCFTDSLEFALQILKLFPQSFFGFTGCITFAEKKDSKKGYNNNNNNNNSNSNSNSDCHLHRVIQDIPLDRILLETDGPYMAPIPYRGAISHSGYICLVAQAIAQIKKVDTETVLQQCRINAKKMYGV